MFFHRAIGKVTFPLISLAFVALSVQTTWQFLLEALPHENWLYHVLGLAVFELGAFCWFSLLTSGAENVLRTLIALIMTVMCVGGVATAAIYEVGHQMSDLGFKMDPAFLQWAPVCVLVGFVSTLVATMLYMAASPHVASRFAHLNATGQEPAHTARIEMLPPRARVVEMQQIAPATQPLALPTPAPVTRPLTQPVTQAHGAGLRASIGNWFSRLGAGLVNGQTTYSVTPAQEQEPEQAEVPAQEPGETADGAQGEEIVDVPEPVMQTSSAPRQTPVHTRSSSAQKGKRSAADIVGLLEIIDAQMPGKSANDLARMIGCDPSTVRRWRASKGGK